MKIDWEDLKFEIVCCYCWAAIGFAFSLLCNAIYIKFGLLGLAILGSVIAILTIAGVAKYWMKQITKEKALARRIERDELHRKTALKWKEQHDECYNRDQCNANNT